jgi:hypothetical protein
MSNFQSSFHIFESRCVITFAMVVWNRLKFGSHDNWQCFFPSMGLDFPKKLPIWSIRNTSSNMEQKH